MVDDREAGGDAGVLLDYILQMEDEELLRLVIPNPLPDFPIPANMKELGYE
jgi:hypothetical protein